MRYCGAQIAPQNRQLTNAPSSGRNQPGVAGKPKVLGQLYDTDVPPAPESTLYPPVAAMHLNYDGPFNHAIFRTVGLFLGVGDDLIVDPNRDVRNIAFNTNPD